MKTAKEICRGIRERDPRAIARAISIVEDGLPGAAEILAAVNDEAVEHALIIGITGPPGAGKSTLTDRVIAEFRRAGRRVGVVAIDPSSPISGGALLGDRVRMMKHSSDSEVVVRSMATRGRLGGLCAAAGAAVRILATAGCSPVVLETVGVGQAEIDIVRLADVSLLVLAPGLGDEIQAMKAGVMELADVLVVNKGDLPGADALQMEMEAAANGRACRVCRTQASTGDGVAELVAAIAEIDAGNRRGSGHADHRRNMFEAEVIDWAVELLRPLVAEELEATKAKLGAADPRVIAAELVRRIRK